MFMRQCLKESELFFFFVVWLTGKRHLALFPARTIFRQFVDAIMVFTKVVSKLSRQQNFAFVRKNLNGTMMAFAECCRKFREL